jgi:hypothetical protein
MSGASVAASAMKRKCLFLERYHPLSSGSDRHHRQGGCLPLGVPKDLAFGWY